MPVWGLLPPLTGYTPSVAQTVTTAFVPSTFTIHPPIVLGGKVITVGPANLSDPHVEMGLGGSFRNTLISEQYAEGAWMLSELYGSTVRDLLGRHNGVIINPPPMVRGVPFDVPEGMMGMTLPGSSTFVEVYDSPTGFGHLSLEGGDMDIVFLMKTTTNDSVNRGIVIKQMTTPDSEGWHVSLVSGQIEFYLKVGGVEIFNFRRGAVADGEEHLIHCCYETTGVGARIFIDGVQSGAAVAASTEPAVTTVQLRFGWWMEMPTGTGPYIGSLAAVMVGREGDSTLAARLQAARVWTDVSDDVRGTQPINISYGIRSTNPVDRMAASGTMQLTMDNSVRNSGQKIGYYSPDHVNARTGFELRVPIRVSVLFQDVWYVKFRGFITSITPMSGLHNEQSTAIGCADWLNEAAEQYLGSLETLSNIRSQDVVKAVLDRADQPPPYVDIDIGDTLFVYAIDNAQAESTTILQELTRVNASEFGWAYLRGDGTFVFEGRTKRRGMAENIFTFDTSHGVTVTWNRDALYNAVRATVYPRVLASEVQLFSSSTFVRLAPNESAIVEAPYSDPNNPGSSIGATNIQTPVAGTDYQMWADANGTGTDLTANLVVRFEPGGSTATFRLTNVGNQTGFVTMLKVRGTPVTTYEPLIVREEDAVSIRKYRKKTVTLDMPYQGFTTYARTAAQQVLSVGGAVLPVARELSLYANYSSVYMQQALEREIGDRIGVSEYVTGVTATVGGQSRGYFISSVDFTIEPERQIKVRWGLSPADQIPTLEDSVVYTGPEAGQADLNFAPLSLGTPGDYEFTLVRGKTYRVKGVAGGAAGLDGSLDSTNAAGGAGGGGGASNEVGVTFIADDPSWVGHIGAGGTSNGAAGADTWFGPLNGTKILHLGGAPVVQSINVEQNINPSGGAVIVGAGGIAGGPGGHGWRVGFNANGTQAGVGGDSSGGTGGGGGAGSPQSSGVIAAGQDGGEGGDGPAAAGGAGGTGSNTAGVKGTDGASSSGTGGVSATGTKASGGGGGGGGVTLGTVTNRGGGGGGGGGANNVVGPTGTGGAGSDGALMIELVG